MPEIVLILTTVPEGELGGRIAERLVDERIAACVHIGPPMTSVYRWRGVVERAAERQLVIKTTRAHVPSVQACIAALHSYDLPEFIVLGIEDGSSHAYLEWVAAETSGGSA